MAEYVFTSPDGKKYRVRGDGSKEEAFKALQERLNAQNTEGPTKETVAGMPEQPEKGFLGKLGDAALTGIKSAIPLYGTIDAAVKNPDAVRQVSEGMTFGFGDEGSAAIEAALGDPKTGRFFDYSRPFGERYQSGVEQEKAKREGFAERNPKTAAALEIGGALGTGTGLGRAGLTLMRPGMSKGAQAVTAALEGGAYGGTYAAGKAPPGEKLAAVPFGAGSGAAAGMGLSLLGGALGQRFGNYLRRRAVNQKAPQFTDEISNEASRLYQQADARGVRLGPQAAKQTADAARRLAQEGRMLLQSGKRLRGYDKVWNVIDQLDDIAKGGGITPGEMVRVRRLMDEARKQGGVEGRFGREIMELWDTLAERMAPELGQARQLWQAARKAEQLEKIFGPLVDLRSGQYASGGAMNAVKTEARQLARRIEKGLERGWTPDELAMLHDLASPGGGRAALEWISKWTPRSPFSAAAGGGMTGSLAGAATGSWPLGLAVGAGTAGAGAGARAIAEALQSARVQNLTNLTRIGGNLPAIAAQPGIPAGAIRAGAGTAGAATEQRRREVLKALSGR